MDTEQIEIIFSKLANLENQLVKINATQSEIAKDLSHVNRSLGVLTGERSGKGHEIGLSQIHELLKKLIQQ
jgi:hypothetical protein